MGLFCSSLVSDSAQHMESTEEKSVELTSGCAINAEEGAEKKEPSYTVGDPAIPLLGIHTEETRIERNTCTPRFIAALCIIARTWKQPRCPSADEG